eukprot:scpid50739/ scgid33195/ 
MQDILVHYLKRNVSAQYLLDGRSALAMVVVAYVNMCTCTPACECFPCACMHVCDYAGIASWIYVCMLVYGWYIMGSTMPAHTHTYSNKVYRPQATVTVYISLPPIHNLL